MLRLYMPVFAMRNRNLPYSVNDFSRCETRLRDVLRLSGFAMRLRDVLSSVNVKSADSCTSQVQTLKL